MNNVIISFRIPETQEQRILYAILNALKIDDITLRYRYKKLFAEDNWGNSWKDKEFYRFLVDEAIVWTGEKDSPNLHDYYSSATGIKDSLLCEFRELCKKYNIIL